MIKSAVTISLVEPARKGPFVFHDDLADACRTTAGLGFDAVEVFAPSGEAIRSLPLNRILKEYGLDLAAVGTGAGLLIHGLHLCDADRVRRQQAEEFIRDVIDAGADFGAPTIIGSMQGRLHAGTDRLAGMQRLQDSLGRLGQHAAKCGVRLIFEPLNRYETNLVTTIAEGIELIESASSDAVVLLADLFHMNIEESCLVDALRTGGDLIGHVHFVDSNRQAAGRGHLDFVPIAAALAKIGFEGYASAEAFPIPDSGEAARQTIETFRRVFR